MTKILITGGHGDIAISIAKTLEREGGYDIALPGRNELDVTDWESADKFMASFTPDILINNAGYIVPQSIREASHENVRKHIDVNLSGVFICTASALRRNPSISVINIGSSAATKVHAFWSGYCATKAAVVMASQCWAAEGIYSVCISPGRTRTKMRKSLYPDEDQSTLMLPDDFAEVVLKAVKKEYPSGSHINVSKQNVGELLGKKN
ncbi:MAG: SDR family oxidoreductase [Synergistaceae bacterium]|nr:SDR family oxidoreductase [Synergistaceae bacterium]